MLRLALFAFILSLLIVPAPVNAVGRILTGTTITVTVNAKEEVFIDGVRINLIDLLSQQLQQRLWRSYMGNGKMPAIIHLQFDPAISIASRALVIDAIRLAQERTLTVLCLEKYKKKFEDTSNKQQDKLKKKFPVLFQQTYPTGQ